MITGALVGLVAGMGVLLLASWLRARRPLPITLRIGPFVGIPGTAVASLDRRRSRALPVGGWHRLVAYVRGRSGLSVAGVGVGVLAAVMGAGLVAAVILGVTAALGGWWGRDLLARRQARLRRLRIHRQLPMLTDLVALAVAAGSGPVDALTAAASTLGGPIAEEVARATAAAHAGASMEAALRQLARAVDLTAMDRFVDAVTIALQTGSPLADVARAQASDIRVDERRRLMEAAGRKDVGMLVPIVFLVLPSVVLVALFPGLHSLRLVLP